MRPVQGDGGRVGLKSLSPRGAPVIQAIAAEKAEMHRDWAGAANAETSQAQHVRAAAATAVGVSS
jgi:hypothetical protein